MKNENDLNLNRLFSQINELEPDESFVNHVSKRISRRRYLNLVIKTVCICTGLLLIGLAPHLLMGLTFGIVYSFNLFAHAIIMIALTPAGYAIGSVIGLLFFLRMRF